MVRVYVLTFLPLRVFWELREGAAVEGLQRHLNPWKEQAENFHIEGEQNQKEYLVKLQMEQMKKKVLKMDQTKNLFQLKHLLIQPHQDLNYLRE